MQAKNLTKISPAMVVLLAAFLRLYQLGAESLWVDEGYSLRDATDFRFSIFRPLYFLMLSLWMRLGHSEAWLRLLAALFGIASIALMYYVGRRLFGHNVGVLAALLMALSTLHVNHSQEIRMYSLATFLALAEVLFFIRYLSSARARDSVSCLALAILAFLTSPLTALMIPVLNLFLVLHFRMYKTAALRWFSIQMGLAIAAVPFFRDITAELQRFGDAWSWGMAAPGGLDVVRATYHFLLWEIPSQYKSALMAGDAFGVLLLALAAYGTIHSANKARWQVAFAALWFAVPIVALVIISHLLANVWMVRYMIYASPAYFLLVALGLRAIYGRRAHWLVIAVLLIALVGRLALYYGRTQHPQWRQAVAYLQENLSDGDAVGVFRYGYRHVFEYYYSGQSPYFPLGPTMLSKSSVEGWDSQRASRTLSAIPSGSRRIWFVLSYGENTGEYAIESYILEHYHVLDRHDFERVRVYLVAPPAQAFERPRRDGKRSVQHFRQSGGGLPTSFAHFGTDG